MGHVWGRGDVPTRFWLGNLREGDQLEDVGVDGRVLFSWSLQKCDGRAWRNY
jgi:hypothetical protein